MGRFFLGLIVGIVLLPAAAYVYLRLGYAPVATDAAPLPLERAVTHMAMRAAVDKGAPKQSPVPPTEENLIEGARLYMQYCSVCHDNSAGVKSAVAKGEFPKPPALVHGKGVTDDPVGVTYWKVANGIRLSGMPGFRGSLTETQLWQVSQLLANANHLPAEAQKILAEQPPVP
jgi:mono/diheme cytochrome c family protein